MSSYPCSDKLVFEVPLPSPLGRVAERSEVGRGSLPHCICFAFSQKAYPKNLFRQPFGLPPSPKGKARRCAHRYFNQQFIALPAIPICVPQLTPAGSSSRIWMLTPLTSTFSSAQIIMYFTPPITRVSIRSLRVGSTLMTTSGV